MAPPQPYPPYPIDELLPELKEALRTRSSVVLHAPPGAGKTTRVPLALLDLLPPEAGKIIMLEPRRLAAVSAARWMARTQGEEAGGTVGYTIRFDRRVSALTRIEVVTEGILTRRIQADPGLEGTALVIFDEFHERSLPADLALALLLDLRRALREDLKLLVMSATLDVEPIAALLDNAPVIASGGREFPVEERYVFDARSGAPSDFRTVALAERAAAAVRTALHETAGDILVFLPGAGEIRACAEALKPVTEQQGSGISLYPLYGDLPFEEQERAILPSEERKVVLATNIAETSLTIEGVGVVIDSGFTRRLQYDPSTGMNRLITVSVSKAAAEQRKGRAGRRGPGICYRLYSPHAFQAMLPFAPPEIVLTDLSSLVLELAVWGVKDPSALSWLDAPPDASCESARRLLRDLGGLDASGSATAAGRAMARLPVHPRLARLLLRAKELGALRLGADLAALLSERDILRRGVFYGSGRLSGPRETDIAERLDLLRDRGRGRELPSEADPWAVRAVERTSGQLARLLGEGRAIEKETDPDPDSEMVSRLLLCAFPDRVGKLREGGGGRFLLSGGSGVRLAETGSLGKSPFIIAVTVDAGDKGSAQGEGRVHLAAPVSEALVRQECSGSIEAVRRVEWDKREGRVVAAIEERLGAVLLSAKPFSPSDEEAAPLICEAIRANPAMLLFSNGVRQFQGRVGLMRRAFPEEEWPDLPDSRLFSTLEEWLPPWLGRARTARDIAGLDLLPALRARLSWNQQRLLDERAPLHLTVPSGHRVALDYAQGDIPLLAVKLQEMFGLADTPVIAGGRVKVLLHLLSPARRPVQVTQDLKGFWNSGYHQVKRELKGRYPKHPWPDDPWNAVPTRKAKPRGSG